MRRCIPLMTGGLVLAFAWAASADVSMTDKRMLRRQVRAEKARELKKSGDVVAAPAAVNLVDGSGLEWFLNTNMTTSSSASMASGAMSEASYTTSVTATYVSTYTTTTISGGTTTVTTSGTTQSQLNDAFDGYNALCISTTGATGPCSTGSADYTIYNQNGAAAVEANGRQVDFPVQTIGTLDVSRKVYVPSADSFARWLNIVTNNDSVSQSVTVVTSNNLGSDSNTVVVYTSDSDTTAELTDRWVVTGQGIPAPAKGGPPLCCSYVSPLGFDPVLGHVLQGPGAAVSLASINFVNADGNPYWSYTFTLAPGQTGIVMNFATGQPSKAAAASKAAELAALPAAALLYMSATEQSQVLNFAIGATAGATRADFNADGKEDLLFRQPSTGDMVAWYMDGVTRTDGAALSAKPASGWLPIGVGDFGTAVVTDKDVTPQISIGPDGKPDLLIRNQTTGDLVAWFMDGVTKAGGAALSQKPASTSWVPVGIGDFGSAALPDKDLGPLVPVVQDSKPDILFRNTATGDVVVWYMDGVTRTGGAALSQKPGAGWVPVGVADFGSAAILDKDVGPLGSVVSYDGKPDILLRNSTTGDFVVWYMDGVTRTGGAALSPAKAAAGWQLAALGDYNADGKTDIVWQYPATGDVVVWYMDGVTKTGGAATSPTKSALPWQVIAPR